MPNKLNKVINKDIDNILQELDIDPKTLRNISVSDIAEKIIERVYCLDKASLKDSLLIFQFSVDATTKNMQQISQALCEYMGRHGISNPTITMPAGLTLQKLPIDRVERLLKLVLAYKDPKRFAKLKDEEDKLAAHNEINT